MALPGGRRGPLDFDQHQPAAGLLPGNPPLASARNSVRPALLLCLLLFVIYSSNLRNIQNGDTLPARYLPFALLLDGNVYLEDWMAPFLQGTLRDGGHFLAPFQGHLVSTFPIATPVVATPIYAPAALWLARQPPDKRRQTGYLFAETLEKISAAAVASASAAVLCAALAYWISIEGAIGLALLYGLASSTWSISSQALWQHGLTQLCLAVLLWALLRAGPVRSTALLAGLALGVAAANRPTNVLLLLPMLVYFGRRGRAAMLAFCVPVAIAAALVFTYNLWFFGDLLGGYPTEMRRTGRDLRSVFGFSAFAEGMAGLLISPSRGLLLFTPWTVFALWGAVRLWREERFPWFPYMAAGSAALFVLYGSYDSWAGGYCYGPRLLADLLPFLTLCLVPMLPLLAARRTLRFVFGASLICALWLQAIGAYYYPNGRWDDEPPLANDPSRLWDWRDPVHARAYRAGPAQPDLWLRWAAVAESHRHQHSEQR